GLRMDLQRLPREHFEHFFEGPKASGKNEESVRALRHQRLACMHGAGDMEFRYALMRDFKVDQNVWDDADDVPVGREHCIRDRAHQADLRPTIDEADAAERERFAELDGYGTIDGTFSVGGRAKYGDAALWLLTHTMQDTARCNPQKRSPLKACARSGLHFYATSASLVDADSGSGKIARNFSEHDACFTGAGRSGERDLGAGSGADLDRLARFDRHRCVADFDVERRIGAVGEIQVNHVLAERGMDRGNCLQRRGHRHCWNNSLRSNQ